jgi:hypothetical protein
MVAAIIKCTSARVTSMDCRHKDSLTRGLRISFFFKKKSKKPRAKVSKSIYSNIVKNYRGKNAYL